MCLLFETIRIENGRLCNLEWHSQRISRSISELFGGAISFDLESSIAVPDYARIGIYKCKLFYDPNLRKIEFDPYRFPNIGTLKVIETGTLEYKHKFASRAGIGHYFAMRGSCDDILMTRNGLFTDTSFCNVIFDDGCQWVTPAEPLLPGTRRHALIAGGRITEQHIGVNDLGRFNQLILINAMIAPGDIKPIPVDMITM